MSPVPSQLKVNPSLKEIPQSSSKSRLLSPTTPKRINSKRSVYTKDFLPHYKVLVSLATIFHWIKDCLNFPEKDSFLPLDRLHTLRWATSYLLFCIYSRERVPSVSITLCCPKWCCSCSGIFSCAIERSHERPLRSRLPLVCGYCFYPQRLTLFNSPLTISANWFAFLAIDMVRGVLDGFV